MVIRAVCENMELAAAHSLQEQRYFNTPLNCKFQTGGNYTRRTKKNLAEKEK